MKRSTPGGRMGVLRRRIECWTSRREFLHVGVVAGLGLTLGDLFLAEARALEANKGRKIAAKAKCVIHIFLPGGMAHQESFDPKPFAPVEYRGPFQSVATRIPGVHFCELWRRTAEVADKLVICRTLTHGEAAHERGTHNLFTGYRPSPAIQYPSIGSVIAHELGPATELPPYVCIPGQPNTYAGSGYLSPAYGPFSLGSDPAQNGFQVRDLALPADVEPLRFARRQRLLETVDAHFKTLESSDALDAMDSFYQRAYALLSSDNARRAFRLEEENDATRNEYGRTEAGARMLLARRLIEGGVRFVSLVTGGFDFHDRIRDGMGRVVPPIDQALAALIRDLEQRGLLETTLVMVTTEFGRTPKINPTEGRDHWPRVFSILLAGGGLKRGCVYGNSDATASDVESDPLTVEELATTVYHQMGIDGEKELMAPGNRPIEIVKDGTVVQALVS